MTTHSSEHGGSSTAAAPAEHAHTYSTQLVWRGSTAGGYRNYSREHAVAAPPAAEIPLSADPAFRGDASRTNPEQLLLMAASSCQLLSFLALAAKAGVNVIDYEDAAEGVMPDCEGPMRIESITLMPTILVGKGTDHDIVRRLVEQAHHDCYIANSLATSVSVTPTVVEQ